MEYCCSNGICKEWINLMYIPSNFTLEEILGMLELPDTLKSLLKQQLAKEVELSEEIQTLYKRIEILEEQVYFRDEFIESTITSCKSTTKHKDLVKEIREALEDSYIEISF